MPACENVGKNVLSMQTLWYVKMHRLELKFEHTVTKLFEHTVTKFSHEPLFLFPLISWFLYLYIMYSDISACFFLSPSIFFSASVPTRTLSACGGW